MRAACWLLVGALSLGAGPWAHADEGAGLVLPRLQGRIRLGMGVEPGVADLSGSSLARISGASLLGDYYFSRFSAGPGEASGFRATTGVFLGSQLGLWGGPGVTSSSLLSVESHSFSLAVPVRGVDNGASQDAGAVPYLGLGYSGLSLKGGLSFSADLGLMALNPGNAIRLGRVIGGGQSVDELVRDLRLSPVIQVGVSYSFW
ncbi:MAG TPA: hypothetical protein VGJ35_05960 [Burkholderiaceae bacterium]|jgi:hypothetical protein